MFEKPLVELPECKCLRCGATWIPRTPNPTVCPKCHCTTWNKKDEELSNYGRPRKNHESNHEVEDNNGKQNNQI